MNQLPIKCNGMPLDANSLNFSMEFYVGRPMSSREILKADHDDDGNKGP